MSRISKMKIQDILKRTDLIIRESDILYVCEDTDVINNFIKKMRNEKPTVEELKQFLIENDEHINKEKFILLTVKNYIENIKLIQKYIDNYKAIINSSDNDKEHSKMSLQLHQQQENLKKAINLGRGIEIAFPYYYYDERQKRYRIEVIDSKEYIDGQKVNISKATKRFDELDLAFKEGNPNEELGLEYVLQSMILTDLYNVFVDPEIGNQIRTMILENQVIKSGMRTKEELEKLKTLETYNEYIELVDSVDLKDLLPYVKETLREYAYYIDLDKLLLVSAYRFNEAIENDQIHSQVIFGVQEILQEIINNIKSSNAQVSCELQDVINDTYEFKKVTYGVKDIEKCLKRFVGETYLSSKKIEEYKNQIYSGEIRLLDIPNEYVDIIFSSEELEKLGISSPENLLYVFKKQNWEKEHIIELYEENIISLEDIQYIKNNIDLSDIISLEKLNIYYRLSIEDAENEEGYNDYSNYLEIYKEIFIKDKDEKEIQLVSNQIMENTIETFEEEEYNQVVREYLKNGLLTVESIAEWNDEEFIKGLFDDGYITLDNMKTLVINQKISSKYLNEIYVELINNEKTEYTTKLELIRSGFVKENDILELYRRNLLFENDLIKLAGEGFVKGKSAHRLIDNRTLEELEKNSSIILTGLNNLEKKNNDVYVYPNTPGDYKGEMEQTGKFIIDPNEREKFLRLLRAYRANTDLNEESPFYNYEFYVIPDESGTIGLNSVVIAERYYEDKDTERRFATDNATYFFKYKDLMVLGNLKKSEMTKERTGIVFTASHVIANESKKGRWAINVISSLTKAMMSCDLKEYTRDEQNIIVLQKLKDVYTREEIMAILNMAEDIDLGKYTCEIEQEIARNSKGKRKAKKINGEER